MSGNADTIKDFLVSLGFDIDQAGANKFEAGWCGVTANVLKVGAVVEGAARFEALSDLPPRLRMVWIKFTGHPSGRGPKRVQGIKRWAMPHRKTGASA
ncbi:hypothetical protein QWI30_30900 [Citrobacter freundii]|nr:hypothetical protein [Citrobacter freundii]